MENRPRLALVSPHVYQLVRDARNRSAARVNHAIQAARVMTDRVSV